MSKYLDMILKVFKMDQSKKGFLPVLQGVRLSSAQCPTTVENRKENERHSLCPSHRFYKVCYAMYQTYYIPCFEFGKGVQ